MVWYFWVLNWMPEVFRDISVFWPVRTLGIVQPTACLACSLLSHKEFHPICAQLIIEQMSQTLPVQFHRVFSPCASINYYSAFKFYFSYLPQTLFSVSSNLWDLLLGRFLIFHVIVWSHFCNICWFPWFKHSCLANFKLPMWHHWTQDWGEISAVKSCELMQAGPSKSRGLEFMTVNYLCEIKYFFGGCIITFEL